MPRFTAEFRFDSPELTEAKSFGRGIRQAGRNANAAEWERRNARLLRIAVADTTSVGGDATRYAARVKFDAPDLADAQRFARWLRQAARHGVPIGRYGDIDRDAWHRNYAALLKLVDPDVAVAPEAPVEDE